MGTISAMAPAIAVENLIKRYGDFTALAGVSFAVEPGTIFGLLGPNGAGKTTTVRILATVLKPDSGLATILGEDVARHPERVRFRIGLAGQFAAVDPHLTGRENLKLIGRLAQLQSRFVGPRADELLDRFRLSAAANKPVRAYSGGMRRRLDIAAALVQQPEVLFLDEPTTGLDVHSRNELWALIRELVRAGTTVLLTTQYLEEADQLAGQIAVIDDGKLIANDTPHNLKARMGDTVLELLYAGDDAASRAAAEITPLHPDHVERDHSTLKVTTTNSVHDLGSLLPRLEQSGLAPDRLVVREPSLDDVFIALTGKQADAGDDSAGSERSKRKSRRKRGAA